MHVSHAIIDGVIDTPATKGWLKDLGPEAKLSADGVSVLINTGYVCSTDGFRLQTITGICTPSL